MPTVTEISRPGNVQMLEVEHEDESFEATKERYQKRIDGSLETVEEYRIEDDEEEEIPEAVVDAIEEKNAKLE